MSMKKAAVILLTLLLTGGLFLTASAHASATAPTQTVELGNCTIEAGEILSYTTVSAQFADQDLPEGMYAGELTVNLTGPIVVEQGGTLSIGTLSVGSDQERSPVIHATLSSIPLIVVKSGGSLILTDVTLDATGEGLLIVQEPGSSISLTATQIPQELIQWAPPTVDNGHDSPEDIWLEEGTLLTASHLPNTLTSNLQYQGKEERMELPLCWDMSVYDGRTTGEMTLTGAFLDENGDSIPSILPLTTTVHWYQPEELVVTQAIWKGENACSAHFVLLELPEYAQVVGEISTDGGKTWTAWPDFDVGHDSQGDVVCNFYDVENTPQHYRLVATNPWEPAFWTSKSFLLPQEEGDDSEGNRGGSTTPEAPEREPTPPEPQPSQGPQPTQEPQPTPTPSWQSGSSAQLEAAVSPEPEQTPAPDISPTPPATSQPELTPSPAPTASTQPSIPHQSTTPSNTTQVVLVVAGIWVCAGLGIWVAWKRS